MDRVDEWFEKNLKTDEIKASLKKVLEFFSFTPLWQFYCERHLSFSINLDRLRRAKWLGSYSEGYISVYEAQRLLTEGWLDVVFVHESAHFIDESRKDPTRRYRFSSTTPRTKEKMICELFRSHMDPYPESRSNYRGRPCEIFARTIEEYYAIATNNNLPALTNFDSNDYYLKIETYKKEVFPFVEQYLKLLR